jgi:hypothetical protein
MKQHRGIMRLAGIQYLFEPFGPILGDKDRRRVQPIRRFAVWNPTLTQAAPGIRGTGSTALRSRASALGTATQTPQAPKFN